MSKPLEVKFFVTIHEPGKSDKNAILDRWELATPYRPFAVGDVIATEGLKQGVEAEDWVRVVGIVHLASEANGKLIHEFLVYTENVNRHEVYAGWAGK